ncbi:MAG: MFS transporter, partial [Cutibacterium granulosum]|nr:MFS transporter [Cutibacterium granulosum]
MTSLSYPDLFRLTGRGFAITSLLARLPLAMSQMGTMLLVSSPLVAGRMGPGGAAAGAVAAAIAVGSPIVGAFTDRHGQRTILLVQSIVAGLGLIGEAVAALCGAAWPVIAAIGVVIGLFL